MAMPVPTAHTMMPKRRLDEVRMHKMLRICVWVQTLFNLLTSDPISVLDAEPFMFEVKHRNYV